MPNQKIVILVFKGRDLHSGYAPSEDPTCRQRRLERLSPQEREFYASRTVCRGGIVSYSSEVATSRKGTMSIMPLTGYGNEGMPAAGKKEENNYALQPLPSLGTMSVARTRLAIEHIMHQWNSFEHGDMICIDPREQLRRGGWKDQNGREHRFEDVKIYHTIEDAKELAIRRGRYLSHLYISRDYDCIGVTKATYRAKQAGMDKPTPAALVPEQPRLVLMQGIQTPLKRPQAVTDTSTDGEPPSKRCRDHSASPSTTPPNPNSPLLDPSGDVIMGDPEAQPDNKDDAAEPIDQPPSLRIEDVSSAQNSPLEHISQQVDPAPSLLPTPRQGNKDSAGDHPSNSSSPLTISSDLPINREDSPKPSNEQEDSPPTILTPLLADTEVDENNIEYLVDAILDDRVRVSTYDLMPFVLSNLEHSEWLS